ncbi:MAG: UDP-N-acetylmuramate--L-alanine ligase [Spirochaetaceae bacterium]|nr:UDP-N-acetylmuramate--L-alanine ligase [Spirochaetaceae bacterium]
MEAAAFPQDIANSFFYCVGIKGTGMAAIAELLARQGARVGGSDTAEVFYTDAILRDLAIPFHESFDAAHVPEKADRVIYSAAYSPEAHPELLRARELGIPLMSFPEALGAFSRRMPSAGITGVHGKTTTTALAGTLVRELKLSGCVLAGSAAANFGDRSTWTGGDSFFIAETCEYRRHFLHFRPRWIVLTSVEADHLDYFKDAEDIAAAFLEYCRLLPEDGTLVYCADDEGARGIAHKLREEKPSVRFIPYGRSAEGPYRVVSITEKPGATVFRLAGIPVDFEARIPGLHTVLNCAAALALVCGIHDEIFPAAPLAHDDLARAVAAFRGSRRRSEVLGEARGILFMDDYAHHPTAIATTLAGLRSFYPGRRIVADFMSHTYSRTAALLGDFAASFSGADLVMLHKIYASAREANPGGISGKDLFEKTRRLHPRALYREEVMDAAECLKKELKADDLFITLGAGDNWRIGKALYEEFSAAEHAQGASP